MLVNIDKGNEQFYRLSYELLRERYSEADTINLSTSLQYLPSYHSHKEWLKRSADKNWYFYSHNGIFKGMVLMRYETEPNEVGIYVFSKYRRQGIGYAALSELLDTVSDITVYAMINPNNIRSQGLFTKAGFVREDETKWSKYVS